MLKTAPPRHLSSSVWVFASVLSLGLGGCAAVYNNKVGITPQPAQILWNTNGPAQISVPPPAPTPTDPNPVPPVASADGLWHDTEQHTAGPQ
jgi:hypothetical protein